MAKRFTETAKWDDAWFVSLTPTQKLAWFYLCDRCDIAGVVDLAVSLAEFHLGGPFDWDEFIAASDGRIERMPCGKLYLTRFIQWQYGELNENCNAHRAVLKAMNKHGLPNPSATLGQPFPNPTRRDQDKDKDKDQDKDLKGGVGENLPGDEERFVEAWNQTEGVRPVRAFSGKRRTAFKARVASKVEGRPWLDVALSVLSERFPLPCTRGSPGGWKPDVEWFLKPDSLLRILEGRYDWQRDQRPADNAAGTPAGERGL